MESETIISCRIMLEFGNSFFIQFLCLGPYWLCSYLKFCIIDAGRCLLRGNTFCNMCCCLLFSCVVFYVINGLDLTRAFFVCVQYTLERHFMQTLVGFNPLRIMLRFFSIKYKNTFTVEMYLMHWLGLTHSSISLCRWTIYLIY